MLRAKQTFSWRHVSVAQGGDGCYNGKMRSVEAPPEVDTTTRRLALARRAGLILFALAFAVHFFRFSRPGLRSWFSTDDAMNLYFVWTRPLGRLIGGCFAVFVPYTRPLGQAYYLLLYNVFGFDPLPFNVVRLVVAALDVVVLYLAASRLLKSRSAAMCALILAGVHPAIFSIYFDTGMIYDALAFLFYWLTFWVYLGIRQREAVPGWRAMLGLLALYTCALNSKEISVTLPLAVLLYELVSAPPRLTFAGLRRWLGREGRFALAGALVTVVFLAVRLLGPDSLYRFPGYRPTYSLDTYFRTYGTYAAEFLNRAGWVSRPVLAALLGGSIVLAALTRRRVLLWAALFNLIAVLPIAFIDPRLGFAFYVPVAGWGLLLAGLLASGCDLAEKIPLGRRFQPEVRHAAARVLLVVALAGVVVPWYTDAARGRYRGAFEVQQRIRTWYREARYLLPTIPPHSRILVLREPPKLEWALHFLLPLACQDRTITIRTVQQLKSLGIAVRPADETIFLDYREGHFRLSNRAEAEELLRQWAL
jgi:hypothetical protein